jgi:hypothetical protein
VRGTKGVLRSSCSPTTGPIPVTWMRSGSTRFSRTSRSFSAPVQRPAARRPRDRCGRTRGSGVHASTDDGLGVMTKGMPRRRAKSSAAQGEEFARPIRLTCTTAIDWSGAGHGTSAAHELAPAAASTVRGSA